MDRAPTGWDVVFFNSVFTFKNHKNFLLRQSGAKAQPAKSKDAKKKPEGMSDADWQKTRNEMLGNAYLSAGIIQAGSNRYADADRNLKAALPLVGGASTSYIYYYLGVSNYQMGKMTTDKSKMATGLQYTEKAAGIAGPMQTQASNNAAIMKRELAGGR